MKDRVKILELDSGLIMDIFKNGSRRFRFEGMPDDAVAVTAWIYGAAQDQICIKVHSESFPVVEQDALIPDLIVTATEFPPCQHLNSPSVN